VALNGIPTTEYIGSAALPEITAETLGFTSVPGAVTSSGEVLAWTKSINGLHFSFRILRILDELLPTEPLQREVMGCTELDMTSANEMVVVNETGGDVIGVFGVDSTGHELLAMSLWWGGYVNHQPRVLSDLMAVRADQRSFGLGTELKKLQAALALQRGFKQIVWTVDPLRAANARLNIEKLGAVSSTYEINRYGDSFGAGLYGGMPTDRLHMEWNIESDSVRSRLFNPPPPRPVSDTEGLSRYDLDGNNAVTVIVHLPNDIDALVANNPEEARRWRMSMRETLQSAFAADYVITGFVPQTVPERALSSFILTRR